MIQYTLQDIILLLFYSYMQWTELELTYYNRGNQHIQWRAVVSHATNRPQFAGLKRTVTSVSDFQKFIDTQKVLLIFALDVLRTWLKHPTNKLLLWTNNNLSSSVSSWSLRMCWEDQDLAWPWDPLLYPAAWFKPSLVLWTFSCPTRIVHT